MTCPCFDNAECVMRYGYYKTVFTDGSWPGVSMLDTAVGDRFAFGPLWSAVRGWYRAHKAWLKFSLLPVYWDMFSCFSIQIWYLNTSAMCKQSKGVPLLSRIGSLLCRVCVYIYKYITYVCINTDLSTLTYLHEKSFAECIVPYHFN